MRAPKNREPKPARRATKGAMRKQGLATTVELRARAALKVAFCALLLGACGQVARGADPSDNPATPDAKPEDPPESKPAVAKAGSIGTVCQPLSELDPEFSGFQLDEVSIDEGTPACGTGICVIHGFQGRVSCPYGQTVSAGGCTIPGSDEPVVVPVSPQLVARPPQVATLCSCRCAGPGPGPFCACPSSLECTHLITDLGFGRTSIAGSYCLPKGARYERGAVDVSSQCESDLANCEL